MTSLSKRTHLLDEWLPWPALVFKFAVPVDDGVVEDEDADAVVVDADAETEDEEVEDRVFS